jgi:hypothetical protein
MRALTISLVTALLAGPSSACPPPSTPPDSGPDAGPPPGRPEAGPGPTIDAGPPQSHDAGPRPAPAILDAGTGFPVLDASPPVPDDNAVPQCKTACATLAQLGCPEAKTVLGGKTCYRVCADAEASGVSLNPTCIGAAKDITAVRACKTVRCQK